MKLSKEAKRLNKEWLKNPKPLRFQMYDFFTLEEAKKCRNLAIKGNHLTEPKVKECSLESLFLWRELPNGEWFLDSVDLAKERKIFEFCSYCGKKFRLKTKNQKYCSIQCSRKAFFERQREKREKIRKCPFCKKEFETHLPFQKFCSRSCGHIVI